MKQLFLLLLTTIFAACTNLTLPQSTSTPLPTATPMPSPPLTPSPTPTVIPIDLSSQMQGPIQAIFAANDYLYLNICSAFVVLDLADSAEPVPVGLHWLDEKRSFCYFGEYVADLFVLDDYAYVAAYAAGLRVVGVTNPTAPVEVGVLEFELPVAPVSLTLQHEYAYIAAGKGGLRVVDIS